MRDLSKFIEPIEEDKRELDKAIEMLHKLEKCVSKANSSVVCFEDGTEMKKYDVIRFACDSAIRLNIDTIAEIGSILFPTAEKCDVNGYYLSVYYKGMVAKIPINELEKAKKHIINISFSGEYVRNKPVLREASKEEQFAYRMKYLLEHDGSLNEMLKLRLPNFKSPIKRYMLYLKFKDKVIHHDVKYYDEIIKNEKKDREDLYKISQKIWEKSLKTIEVYKKEFLPLLSIFADDFFVLKENPIGESEVLHNLFN